MKMSVPGISRVASALAVRHAVLARTASAPIIGCKRAWLGGPPAYDESQLGADRSRLPQDSMGLTARSSVAVLHGSIPSPALKCGKFNRTLACDWEGPDIRVERRRCSQVVTKIRHNDRISLG